MSSEGLGLSLATLLLLLQIWYHIRLTRVEAGVRWILEHVRVVSKTQEDYGYARIRSMFGIQDEDEPAQ